MYQYDFFFSCRKLKGAGELQLRRYFSPPVIRLYDEGVSGKRGGLEDKLEVLLFKKTFDNIHGGECVRTVKRVLIGTVERQKKPKHLLLVYPVCS